MRTFHCLERCSSCAVQCQLAFIGLLCECKKICARRKHCKAAYQDQAVCSARFGMTILRGSSEPACTSCIFHFSCVITTMNYHTYSLRCQEGSFVFIRGVQVRVREQHWVVHIHHYSEVPCVISMFGWMCHGSFTYRFSTTTLNTCICFMLSWRR
jgi:hypothetical protein